MERRRRGLGSTPLGNRPVTLGELLFREENNIQEMRLPPARPLGRIMSPTRRLGPLANGRPRRPRGRALSRSSTVTSTSPLIAASSATSTPSATVTSASSATASSTDISASTATAADTLAETTSLTSTDADAATATSASTGDNPEPEPSSSITTALSVDHEERPSRQSQQTPRRRRARMSPTLPRQSSTRWRNATAQARIHNFHALVNGSRTARHGNSTSSSTRGIRNGVARRSNTPDLFFNPFGWQRSHSQSTGTRQGRLRSTANSGSSRSGSVQGATQSQRGRSTRQVPSTTGARMIDVYDVRSRASTRYLRSSGRPRSARRTSTNRSGSSRSELPAPVRRFIDLAAEFIPVELPAPDAEPPEWSLNVTAADFGPFAIGRSALSRARSLAVMGVLSQAEEFNPNDPNNDQPNPNSTEN